MLLAYVADVTSVVLWCYVGEPISARSGLSINSVAVSTTDLISLICALCSVATGGVADGCGNIECTKVEPNTGPDFEVVDAAPWCRFCPESADREVMSVYGTFPECSEGRSVVLMLVVWSTCVTVE